MRTYELRSNCATVTWQGKIVALDHRARLCITVEDRMIKMGISEPEWDFMALAEIDLNKDFEDVLLKVARPILDFINSHSSEFVDGYDLDELVRSLKAGLIGAGLVDKE